MQKAWDLLVILGFMVVESGCFSGQAIAQEYEGCWMVDSAGAVIDLNGTMCLRSLPMPQLTPLVFSNLQVEPIPDGRVTVSGSVTNRNSQPMPLVLVEYKLMECTTSRSALSRYHARSDGRNSATWRIDQF